MVYKIQMTSQKIEEGTKIRTQRPNQIGVSKRVTMMPIKPGSTRMKDGIIHNIERIPNRILYHSRVVRF